MTSSPQWQAVRPSRHADAGWLPYTDYKHAEGFTTTPLLMAELPQAINIYPLAFVQDDDKYQLVALHSLRPNLNLFVNPQGKWLAPYVPAWYRSYPMRLLQDETNNNYLLCVDEASPLFQEKVAEGGQAFFGADKKPSEEAQQVINFLQQCQQNRLITERQVQRLADAGLIRPWEIKLKNEDGNTQSIDGLFHIDESALQQLPGATLEELAKTGALALAYAQLFASARIKDLETRYQYYQKHQASQELDLDKILGDDDESDSLSFG